ncbi:MAG: hypothetical protein R3336_10305, partial [Phycisphaeraceae bacterium]|nr:hypothetical protein [Phycisphaeraceae bacterium]
LELAPTVDGSTVTCEIPSFRLDLQREVDLVEEVARMVGFGNVPVQEKMDIVARPLQMTVRARRELDTVLVGHGYHETVTFGFLAEKYAQPFAEAGDQLARIDDERRKSEPILRPSLLPSLLACRKGNQDVGNERVRLFEQAATWRKRDGKLVEERHLALLADVEDDAQTAIRDLRTTLEELVDRLAGDVGLGVTPDPDSPETFDAAALLDFNGERLGRMGLLARPTLKRFGLQGAVVAAELDFDLLTASYPPARTSGDLARYPGIERDLSIVVEESTRWSQIASAVEAVVPKLMEGLEFVGTYRGKPIEKGYKSVSLRMVFRDPQQTLRHEQVDPQVAQVLERLQKDVDAQLRGD